MCGKKAAPAYRPFCTRRCADLDLGKWLTGGYAVPSVGEDEPQREIPDKARGAARDETQH